MRLFYFLIVCLVISSFFREGAYLKGTLFKYFLTQGEGSHFNGGQLFEGGR